MYKRTLVNFATTLMPRLRLRVWLVLLWTALVAAAGYWLESPDGSGCAPDDFYCNIGAAAGQSVVGVILVVLIFLVWPLGFGIIWGTAEVGLAVKRWFDEAPERRRYHQESDAWLARALRQRESGLDAGGARIFPLARGAPRRR